MIKTDKLFQVIIVIIGLLLMVEMTGMFEKDEPIGYSEKEVALMIKLKDINDKLAEKEIEFNIIALDNERLKKNIPADSAFVANTSRTYRDSIRAELFR